MCVCVRRGVFMCVCVRVCLCVFVRDGGVYVFLCEEGVVYVYLCEGRIHVCLFRRAGARILCILLSVHRKDFGSRS